MGFIRRDDFRRSFAALRFSPRPASIKWVRKFTWESSVEYTLNGAGSLETRLQTWRFTTEFENSDQVAVEASTDYELLVRPFVPPGSRVTIPSGGYRFSQVLGTYTFGAQRRASGAFSIQSGQYYDGTITAFGYSGGRISATRRLSVEPGISINQVDLPAARFTTKLVRARTDYGFSPRMFATALLQYSSSDRSFSSNLRFRWEYRPGSEFFAVYTEERDTLLAGFDALRNRSFVLKMNRLLRF